MNHKEQSLQEINKMYDPNFEVPKGLYFPLGKDLLIKQIGQPEFKTKGGLIIPKTDKLRHAHLGIVYRVGEDVSKPIKPGMTIAFEMQSNLSVAFDGEVYLVVDEYVVKAVVPPDNYFEPKVVDSEEKRRGQMIDAQENLQKDIADKMEELNG